MRQIIGPFAIAHQIGARHLDLDDRDIAPRIDRHQVGAASAVQRDFGDRDQIVPQQHATHPTRHLRRDQRGIVSNGKRRGW